METKSKFPVLCTGIVSSCAQFAYFVEMCNYTKCAQVENRAVGAVNNNFSVRDKIHNAKRSTVCFTHELLGYAADVGWCHV